MLKGGLTTMISKFVYVIEKLNNNGWISVYTNDDQLTENKEEKTLITFTNESDLLDALKQYKKGGIWAVTDSEEVHLEGKRLAEKLKDVQFISTFLA